MRSVVAAVRHAPEDDDLDLDAGGDFDRRKADERGPSRRDVLAVDSAILLRRAHDVAGVAVLSTARGAGVSKQVASRWATMPREYPPPLYSVLAHPLVELVVGASLSAQAADALALAERLDGDPEAIRHALASLLHAVEVLHTTLARMGL